MGHGDKPGSDVRQILHVDALGPFQSPDFALEEAYACLLLGVLGLKAVDVARLGPQFCLEGVDGLLECLDCRIEDLSRTAFESEFFSRPGGVGSGGFTATVERFPVLLAPSAVSLPVRAASGTELLCLTRGFETCSAFVANLPAHDRSSA